jgi:hypothetical protein
MTETTLENALTLRKRIATIERALNQIHNLEIISIKDYDPYLGEQAVPFLAALSAELKSIAIERISNKLNEMKKEFSDL